MNEVSRVPRIRCAVCNKPVDVIEEWTDVCNSTQIIEVTCHGQKDRMVIPEYLLFELTRDQLQSLQTQEGVAFSKPMIEVQP